MIDPGQDSPWPDPMALGFLTDLYQLTMMAGYAQHGMSNKRATFELIVRKLPPGRSYLMMAGVDQAIESIRQIRFTAPQIAWLRNRPEFSGVHPAWFAELSNFAFEGDIWAIPEGTVVFAGEPLMRVEARLVEAQLIETLLLSMIGYPTLVASKASRIVTAAQGRPIIDFGARRGHGPQAAIFNARASYLAGFAGTSHVESASRFGIPAVGTMAHSWVQSFDSELAAFQAYVMSFPNSCTLLVDTYDIAQGVENAASVSPPIRAIRIDSGDLVEESNKARQILDRLGRRDVQIVISNDLDEFKIQALVAAKAPIDSFGVGTELITSRDAPALSLVYKLVALNGEGKIKKAAGKLTYPLGKQVYRTRTSTGEIVSDHVTEASEIAMGEPLLVPLMKSGQWTSRRTSLAVDRDRACEELKNLNPEFKSLELTKMYPVSYSDKLESTAIQLGLK